MSGLKGSFDCFVGIDVSKDKFDACASLHFAAKYPLTYKIFLFYTPTAEKEILISFYQHYQ